MFTVIVILKMYIYILIIKNIKNLKNKRINYIINIGTYLFIFTLLF